MKDIFPSLIKNERLKQTLSGSLSHAYIIEGARGSGRLTAVRSCAAAALCENRDSGTSPLPCGTCSVCSRIFRGIHPDVSEYSAEEKKSISVDTVRSLRAQVFIAPSESEYKFFVIRDADLMTAEAQNALLISLEEPPPFSVFFLLVSDKALLLETIRSRCVILNTEPLDEETLTDKLMDIPEGKRLRESNPEQLSAIVKSAEGSLGEAVRLLTGGDGENGELHSTAEQTVRTILTGSASDKVRLAASFPKSKDQQTKIYTLAVSAVRDIIACKLRASEELLFYKSADEAAAFTSVPTSRLMTLYSVLEDASLSLSGNSSPALTAERVIMIKLQ